MPCLPLSRAEIFFSDWLDLASPGGTAEQVPTQDQYLIAFTSQKAQLAPGHSPFLAQDGTLFFPFPSHPSFFSSQFRFPFAAGRPLVYLPSPSFALLLLLLTPVPLLSSTFSHLSLTYTTP